ncbi:cytidine deaminase [Lysinibacillus sp. NPDC059133]|uniref:cytidine deaminase n=1 Tax=Lysinibacillus sp. NPDC059133 TaxID=3346737 RepID=UPI00368E9BD2
MNKELLMESARKMKAKAYVPYSKFPVGVALLLKDGAVINGVNVENVSLGATNCAERTAIFTAISNGYQKGDFQAIAEAGDTVDFLPTPILNALKNVRNTELFVYNLDNEGLLQIEDYNTVKGSSVKKPDLKKVSKRLRGYVYKDPSSIRS